MKFKPKPTYFTLQDLELILQFDNQLEINLQKLKIQHDLKKVLEISKKLNTPLKIKYKNGKWILG